MWDPATYLRFRDERARPFMDLIARIGAPAPAVVVDLGCGPGNLTVELAARWPGARVHGLDSAPEMIEAARALGSPVRFDVGDVRDWVADPAIDVVICNATLQWVPGHAELLAGWVRRMKPGAYFALQVPGNFDAPSHRALRAVVAARGWTEPLAGHVREPDAVLDPTGYAALLRAEGCAVDAWETTYLHVLPAGEDGPGADHPVVRWMEGTALRPVRAMLADSDGWASFRAELSAALADEYPVRDGVVYFPFRRVFCVARVE